MSYNYLPLDHKKLHFQQVQHLLAYEQLVSITFTAHEMVEAGEAKLKTILQQQPHLNTIFTSLEPIAILPNESNHEPLPVEIVKLMLMLKLKSISYGQSGVSISTAKALMNAYNHHTFPVVTKHTAVPLQILVATLQQKGAQLSKEECFALSFGSQFTLAVHLYYYTQLLALVKMADIAAAFSCLASQETNDAHSVANVTLTEVAKAQSYIAHLPPHEAVAKHLVVTTSHITNTLLTHYQLHQILWAGIEHCMQQANKPFDGLTLLHDDTLLIRKEENWDATALWTLVPYIQKVIALSNARNVEATEISTMLTPLHTNDASIFIMLEKSISVAEDKLAKEIQAAISVLPNTETVPINLQAIYTEVKKKSYSLSIDVLKKWIYAL